VLLRLAVENRAFPPGDEDRHGGDEDRKRADEEG